MFCNLHCFHGNLQVLTFIIFKDICNDKYNFHIVSLQVQHYLLHIWDFVSFLVNLVILVNTLNIVEWCAYLFSHRNKNLKGDNNIKQLLYNDGTTCVTDYLRLSSKKNLTIYCAKSENFFCDIDFFSWLL
jgi:hypothetical protein